MVECRKSRAKSINSLKLSHAHLLASWNFAVRTLISNLSLNRQKLHFFLPFKKLKQSLLLTYVDKPHPQLSKLILGKKLVKFANFQFSFCCIFAVSFNANQHFSLTNKLSILSLDYAQIYDFKNKIVWNWPSHKLLSYNTAVLADLSDSLI